MVLYTSQITNSLNYSLFALQLGGFVVGFVCSSPPPLFALQISKLSASCENYFWNSPDARF